MKRRLVGLLQKYVLNPPVRAAFAVGLAPPWYAMLETRGRRTGRLRRTPVGNGLAADGRTVWVVAEQGRSAGYVRNIEAEPRVRVRIRGRWRSGVAQVVDDDDPEARLRSLGMPLHAFVVRTMGTDLLSVRIDLDP